MVPNSKQFLFRKKISSKHFIFGLIAARGGCYNFLSVIAFTEVSQFLVLRITSTLYLKNTLNQFSFSVLNICSVAPLFIP